MDNQIVPIFIHDLNAGPMLAALDLAGSFFLMIVPGAGYGLAWICVKAVAIVGI